MIEIPIADETLPNGIRSWSSLKIDDDGRLIFHCLDTGPVIEQMLGCEDYEFSYIVQPADVPRVLAQLMRERFTRPDRFRHWLEAAGIPFTLDTWRWGSA